MPLLATKPESLSHFNVAGLVQKQGFEEFTPPQQPNSFPPKNTQAKSTEAANTRPNPYEIFVHDKPGEELAPDAAIWQLYVNEASEHDTELLKEKNGNLDVMLLFAALFSAIVTAFLVDSKNLLQEDSRGVTVDLLLAIAQSQQRIENGSPRALPVPQRPAFRVPTHARWINGLWFSALSLSLVAALIAMLAKEWLTGFTTSRSHSPRTYARLHQVRLQGMASWRVLYIMDLLPSVLHISLLLFSLGLAVYLLTLDIGIALIQIFIITIALAFYLGTALFAVMYDSCPFTTQVSKYLRRFRSGSATTGHNMEERTTYDDLEALLWLTKNARDPLIGDCACQALAGLQAYLKRLGDGKSQNKNEADICPYEIKAKDSYLSYGFSPLSHPLNRPSTSTTDCGNLMNQLFDQTCARLLQANARHQRDLEACQGMNLARYSSALPALVQYLELLRRHKLTMGQMNKGGHDMGAHSPAQRALVAMDAAWSNDCPQFSPDAYVLLAAAELYLTNTLALIYHPNQRTSFKQCPSPRYGTLDHSVEPEDDGWTEIEIEFDEEATSNEIVSIRELQARYSRSLARASILMSLLNDSQTIINDCSLTHLLDSIGTAANCSSLNPSTGVSTCLPQSEDKNTLPEFTIAIVGTGTVRKLPPNDLGDEDSLLPGIVKILASTGIERAPKVEAAAVKALAALGPVLLRQWLAVMNKGSVEILNKDLLDRIFHIWPKVEESIHLPYLVNRTLAQLACVSVVGISQIESEHMADLAEVAIAAFFSRANMESGKPLLRSLGDAHPELVQHFIRMAALNGSKLSPASRERCIKLLLIQKYHGRLLHSRCRSPLSLPNILRLLAYAPGHVAEAQDILRELEDLLPYYENEEVSYLIGFMRQKEGFKAIVDVAAIPEYTTMAIYFILRLVEVASDKLDEHPQHQDAYLVHDAIEGLLTAMILVIQAEKLRQGGPARLGRLIRGATVIFDRLSEEDLLFTAKHRNLTLIKAEISTFRGSSPEWEEIMDQWEDLEIHSYAPGEEWYLRGLRNLFGSW